MRILSVPKCKECENNSCGYFSLGKGPRYCTHKKEFVLGYGRPIPSVSLRTSPKWCPKRLREGMTYQTRHKSHTGTEDQAQILGYHPWKLADHKELPDMFTN